MTTGLEKVGFYSNCKEGQCQRIFEFSSVPQSYPTLCGPRDCSMPGCPALHYLLELAQTHFHRVGDAIQPSHPLSPPSPPAFNLFQYQALFQWVSYSHQVASLCISPSKEYSGLIPLELTGLISLQSKGLLRVFSNITVQKHKSLALSFLYGPTLTSIHDKMWSTGEGNGKPL